MIALLDRALDGAETLAGRSHRSEPSDRSDRASAGGLRRLTAAAEAVPAAVLTWTWLGSAVGNLVFFGRPAVALYGAVAMGLLVIPYLRLLNRLNRPDRPSRPPA